MSTEWEHQVYVICHSAAIGGAIAALDIAFPRDDGEPRDPGKPWLVGCHLQDSNNVSYYGAAFSVTEKIRETLEGLGLANVPGVTYWRCGNPSQILTATNHANSLPMIGKEFAWEDAKSALGLS